MIKNEIKRIIRENAYALTRHDFTDPQLDDVAEEITDLVRKEIEQAHSNHVDAHRQLIIRLQASDQTMSDQEDS